MPAKFNATNVEDLITSGFVSPVGIALDVAGARCTGQIFMPQKFKVPI